MSEEIERSGAKVKFQHKFENLKQILDNYNYYLPSPTFFARNIQFHLELEAGGNENILCELACDSIKKGESFNVEYQYSLVSPSKIVHSEEFSYTCKYGMSNHQTYLDEMFPGEEIIVDDAVTIEVSLWVEDPEGYKYKPMMEKLRKNLQIVENQVQNDAFASLLDSGDFSDVTFVISEDSSIVKAHKNILAARSEVFARMLTTDMREAKDNEIRIDDMGAPTLKILLRFIYTSQLAIPKGLKSDLKICQELANAGEKYNFQNLKEYAAIAMIEFVTLENAWELLKFVKRLKAEAATKALTSYYVSNVHKIIEKL